MTHTNDSLVAPVGQWVMQSLFLSAIAGVRKRGGNALEASAYHYPEGESAEERFLAHCTVFPSDFPADFGFRTRVGSGESTSLDSISGSSGCDGETEREAHPPDQRAAPAGANSPAAVAFQINRAAAKSVADRGAA